MNWTISAVGSILWGNSLGRHVMAFICVCGVRYASASAAAGCPRCGARNIVRQQVQNAVVPPRPQPKSGKKKQVKPLAIDGESVKNAVCLAVQSHIARIGLPDKEVLESGSPVNTVMQHIADSCSPAELARLRNEAFKLQQSLGALVELEFTEKAKERRTKNRRKPAQVRTVVSGGLPGMGHRA